MKKRIGILGGSFDPVHNGHILIARSFLKSKVIHQLLITPAPSPPHKRGLSATFSHRYEMLKLAFQDEKRILISDIENNLPEPSYTLRTIETLQQKHPDNLFYLCMGGDSLAGLTSWYKYQQIMDKVSLLVAERPGVNHLEIAEHIKENAIFADHSPFEVSSTFIREERTGHQRVENLPLPDKVAEYISNHHLYRRGN
ncbi:MAG: nicotinate (nicotinamide) nucleotide adenylyltransferase [Balneolaceae bacterium]